MTFRSLYFLSRLSFLYKFRSMYDASDVRLIKTYYMVIECRKNYVLFTCFTLYSLYASFHVAVQQNRVTILLQLAIRKFKSECNQTKHETRPKMIKKKLVIPTISWVNKHTRSSISHHSHFHEFNGKKYDFQINSVDYNAQIQWLFFSSLAISIFEYKLLFMCLAVDLCCMCHRILKIVAFLHGFLPFHW